MSWIRRLHSKWPPVECSIIFSFVLSQSGSSMYKSAIGSLVWERETLSAFCPEAVTWSIISPIGFLMGQSAISFAFFSFCPNHFSYTINGQVDFALPCSFWEWEENLKICRSKAENHQWLFVGDRLEISNKPQRGKQNSFHPSFL